MKGVVAAGHPLTAAAAGDVLKAGGNAFDAAIAAVFTACVAEPVLASLGGGGFLLARAPGRLDRVFDFFAQTPINKDTGTEPDFYPVTVNFGHAQQEFHIGLGACATPGCISGLFAVHEHLGSMAMRELIQPALAAARNGVQVSDLQGYIFSLVAPIYIAPGANDIFKGSQADAIAIAGDVLRFPQFADLLEVLAIEGADLFYRGEVARSIEALCESGGGYLRREDLEQYETSVRPPLQVDYHGARILTNPPPSCGGVLVAFGLRLLEELQVGQFNHNDFEHLRRVIDVMRMSARVRVDQLAESVTAEVLADETLRKYRSQVYGHAQFSRGTTHISVVDGEGNVATVTISNGEGCGHVVPDTGIMLNNMLGEEDLNPRGFGRWTGNQRLGSMMSPTIALLPGGKVIATGSGGSNRIRTTLLQVLSNLLDFGCNDEEAVTLPRIHIETEVLNIEGGVNARVTERLISEFPEHRVFADRNLFFGGAHTVSRDGTRFSGAGDPRRGGVCEIVQ